MASIANPNSNNTSSAPDHSRHSTIDNSHPVNSTQSRRGSMRSGPWAQIPAAVVGAPLYSSTPNSAVEPHAAAMSAGSSSYSAAVVVDGNADKENGPVTGSAGRRVAWNKPSNGAVEIEPIMGAVSWPALSDSARNSVKSSSSDSLKGLTDGSSTIHVSQGTGAASSSSQKQQSILNINSAPIHPVPTRQRPMKRDGASTSSNGGTSQPLASSQGPVGELALNNPYPGDRGRRIPSRSGNDHRNHGNHGGNDYPSQQHGSYRNHGNHGGPHWGRRDQDRGNHDWNLHNNFSNRDAHMQPHRSTPRFMRPPPPPPPPPTTRFVAPPPMRPYAVPYAGNMGYHDFSSMYYVGPAPPESLRAVPFAPMPPPVIYSAPDFDLQFKIVNQIDYYFSNENLVKDTFLRHKMDDQGWVPITLIAGFKRVSLLTDNIQLILESIRNSAVVEVQGDRVRRRKDWRRWIMPSTLQLSDVSSPRSSGSPSSLAADFQIMSVEEKVLSNERSQSDASTETSLSADPNNQPHLCSNGETNEVGREGLHSPKREIQTTEN